MVQTLFLVAAVLLGGCVGSFLNVVIYRVPAGTFFSGGSRSRCPNCREAIAAYDNLPVLSWIFLRGKARCCGTSISPRYPLVEALTAVIFGWLFWTSIGIHLPAEWSPAVAAPGWQEWVMFLFRAWFLSALVACTFIDIDHRILPDVITKPTMVIGVVGSAVVPGLSGSFVASPDRYDGVFFSVVGLISGLACTWFIREVASRVFGREAMGFGDVKLMGAIGAFLGWDGAVIAFFLGSLLGALYGAVHQLVTREAQIFFGPFLAAGAVITQFHKDGIKTFVTVTWPDWQQELNLPIWASSGIVLFFAFSLLLIIRRGRRHH